ncbi:MAG: TRAP transporter large permease subunit [Treponema sp.]|nr:TRAP transporter large permease subunit [Treponema sp.]
MNIRNPSGAPAPRPDRLPLLWRIEEGLCYVSLAALTFLPFAESVMRLAFHSRVPASPALITHTLLVAGLVSGMITTRARTHLSIGLAQYIKTERAKLPLSVISGMISSFVTTMLAWCSIAFIRVSLSPFTIIGFIPDQAFALVMPIGYAVIAFRFARYTPLEGKARCAAFLPLLLGTVCSLPQIFTILWGVDTPDFAYTVADIYVFIAASVRTPAFILLLSATLIGTPLFAVIGGVSMLLIQSSGTGLDVVSNQIYTALTNSGIVAIPLFTITGFFLSESRAGERLVIAFRKLFGWIPGGLIAVTVIICAFFTSFTGASGVTILALGGVLYTALTGAPPNGRRVVAAAGYGDTFTIGLLTSAGSIGLLFPPSLPILLVGAATRTNTVHLFLGGIIPGLILVAAMIALGIASSRKTKMPLEPFHLTEALSSLKDVLFELLLPPLLIAGYFTGILSMVEIGAFSVVYVFVVETLVFKEIPFSRIKDVFAKAAPIIGGILSILALAQALSYYIVDSQAPDAFARWIQAAISSKWVFLLILNIALLVTGCLIDIFSAILIILPMIAPLGAAYGIEPVHLGIIFLINMETGFLTPPVGLNLFLSSYRFNRPFVETARAVLPFLLIQLAAVLLVTYVPAISTWLTKLY